MVFPKVSIVIPTYNQSAVIENAIKSALMQDYPNLEVIVGDDSTNNDTTAAASKYNNDERFFYQRNPTSLGKAGNYRNLLYTHATGEWVVNLDGDDYYTDKNFISTAIARITESGINDTLFYMGSYVMLYPDKQRMLQPFLPHDENIMTAETYFYNLHSIVMFCHLGTLYNAALARQAGFYERNITSSDMHSFFKLCLKNPAMKVIISKRIVGNWVQHGNNESSHRDFKKQLENGRYYFDIFNHANKNKVGNLLKNSTWLFKSLFIYWGSFLKKMVWSKK